jgi:hypothetical protein
VHVGVLHFIIQHSLIDIRYLKSGILPRFVLKAMCPMCLCINKKNTRVENAAKLKTKAVLQHIFLKILPTLSKYRVNQWQLLRFGADFSVECP